MNQPTLIRMYIGIGIGGAQMPRLAAFAKYVCMYTRMLTSMYIRIGIGGAQMSHLAAKLSTWGLPDERRLIPLEHLQRLRSQYLYCCASKASQPSTCLTDSHWTSSSCSVPCSE